MVLRVFQSRRRKSEAAAVLDDGAARHGHVEIYALAVMYPQLRSHKNGRVRDRVRVNQPHDQAYCYPGGLDVRCCSHRAMRQNSNKLLVVDTADNDTC